MNNGWSILPTPKSLCWSACLDGKSKQALGLFLKLRIVLLHDDTKSTEVDQEGEPLYGTHQQESLLVWSRKIALGFLRFERRRIPQLKSLLRRQLDCGIFPECSLSSSVIYMFAEGPQCSCGHDELCILYDLADFQPICAITMCVPRQCANQGSTLLLSRRQ